MSDKKCTCGQTREPGEIPVGGCYISQNKKCEAHGVPRWTGREEKTMSARDELIRALELGFNFNTDGAEIFFDKVLSAIKEEIIPGHISTECLEEEKIQGYTAEQWQEIIGGGYVVEMSKTKSFPLDWQHVILNILEQNDMPGLIPSKFFCRPAQIKGVMRPIFVEPVDDPYCVFFDVDGKAIHTGMLRWSAKHESHKYFGNSTEAKSYLEV